MTQLSGNPIPPSVDALALRRRLGRAWSLPEPFGPDGWSTRHLERGQSILVSCSPWYDGVEYLHASIASRRDELPSYDDLVMLRAAVWGEHGWAYQVFAPPAHHVNLHAHALHLWGRLDGAAILPDFGAHGTI